MQIRLAGKQQQCSSCILIIIIRKSELIHFSFWEVLLSILNYIQLNINTHTHTQTHTHTYIKFVMLLSLLLLLLNNQPTF